MFSGTNPSLYSDVRQDTLMLGLHEWSLNYWCIISNSIQIMIPKSKKKQRYGPNSTYNWTLTQDKSNSQAPAGLTKNTTWAPPPTHTHCIHRQSNLSICQLWLSWQPRNGLLQYINSIKYTLIVLTNTYNPSKTQQHQRHFFKFIHKVAIKVWLWNSLAQ